MTDLFYTEEELEKAIMVGVWLGGKNNSAVLDLEGSLEELAFF